MKKELLNLDFELISQFLKTNEKILFALVFGSMAKGNQTLLSDLDIGIYTKNEISLLEMGRIIAGLEKIVKMKVDLVILNDLYKRKPRFAFQVISSARLLFTKAEELFTNFKKNIFISYLDTKPLLDKVNRTLQHRIAADTIGERNCA